MPITRTQSGSAMIYAARNRLGRGFLL